MKIGTKFGRFKFLISIKNFIENKIISFQNTTKKIQLIMNDFRFAIKG